MKLWLDGRTLFAAGDSVRLSHDGNPTGKRHAVVIETRVNGRARVLYSLALYDDSGRRVEIEVDEFEVEPAEANDGAREA